MSQDKFAPCIHGDAFFKFWMKNHCEWMSQHIISNNNNSPPIVLKYQVGIRRGIAMAHGQVEI